MRTALVVDDSKVDQRLVEVILRRLPDLDVVCVDDGRAALEAVGRQTFDVVLTDMLMPDIGGLELIEAIRARHPTVPVVAMTAHGSEEVAADALRKGATSYIPKRHLSRDLPEAVSHVLALAAVQAEAALATQWLAQTECRFVLDGNPQQTDPLVRYIGAEVARLNLFDVMEWMRLGIALSEALANAINHGNLGVGSMLRETDMPAYRALLAHRRKTAPFRDRKVYVTATLSRSQAVFVVRDEGDGFNPEKIADCTRPEHLEKPSGRGMLLIRTFMDEVRHNPVGNEITMVRRGPSV